MAGLAGRRLGCGGGEKHAVLALPGGGPQLRPAGLGAADPVALRPHADPLREARGGGGGAAGGRGLPPPPARQMRLVPAGAAGFLGARAPAGPAQPAAVRPAGLQAAGRHVLRPLLPQVSGRESEPQGGGGGGRGLPCPAHWLFRAFRLRDSSCRLRGEAGPAGREDRCSCRGAGWLWDAPSGGGGNWESDFDCPLGRSLILPK